MGTDMKALLGPLAERARQKEKEYKKYLSRLRERNPKKLDAVFKQLHDEVFAEMECLECANCCRVLGPRFRELDIDRIAGHLNMHRKTFISLYLEIDEDGDYVLRKLPCPFLEENNRCSVYEFRPRACDEYPHTNMKNMRGKLVMTRKNLPVCPAVYEIVERIRKIFPL